MNNAVHDPLDLALSTPSGHTAPTKIPSTPARLHFGFTPLCMGRDISLCNGLDLGGPPDLLPILLAVFLTATTG